MIITASARRSIVDVLSSSFLFCGISSDFISGFIEDCELIDYKTGDIIINSEQFSNALAIVLRGKIAVRRHDTLLNTIAKGGIFGAASLFGGERELYFTTVEAKTKTRILFISQTQLEKLFTINPATALNYIAFLSDRIRFLNKKIDSFTSDNGTTKIVKYLISFKKSEVEIQQSFTKLSESLDIGRATLYRAFDKLEKDGIIKRENKSIKVLDIERLKALDD